MKRSKLVCNQQKYQFDGQIRIRLHLSCEQLNLRILMEMDTYDWITFLPMSVGIGAYNRLDQQRNTIKELLLNIQD
jgi:hypothetical protein